ncbi:Glycosyl hydrolase superfamily protein [Zea mays]|uniref:Glycosyl hydrolase superfamily protein n=1 Tax=Zea mays TaxID=4577 RepID=A0A1D6EHE1_MAIZE|nr:Glycosyl hydrolase superfamily protein [Zea mays]ONM19543.1 Glycosyl hydrolase superfamily protein [Zea mays]
MACTTMTATSRAPAWSPPVTPVTGAANTTPPPDGAQQVQLALLHQPPVHIVLQLQAPAMATLGTGGGPYCRRACATYLYTHVSHPCFLLLSTTTSTTICLVP